MSTLYLSLYRYSYCKEFSGLAHSDSFALVYRMHKYKEVEMFYILVLNVDLNLFCWSRRPSTSSAFSDLGRHSLFGAFMCIQQLYRWLWICECILSLWYCSNLSVRLVSAASHGSTTSCIGSTPPPLEAPSFVSWARYYIGVAAVA